MVDMFYITGDIKSGLDFHTKLLYISNGSNGCMVFDVIRRPLEEDITFYSYVDLLLEVNAGYLIIRCDELPAEFVSFGKGYEEVFFNYLSKEAAKYNGMVTVENHFR